MTPANLLRSVFVACLVSVPSAAESVAVYPGKSSELILNPGKGWVAYTTRFNTTPFSGITPAAWATISTGYRRYHWYEVEPTEGNYNWAMIDADVAACTSRGKKFAFGIMAYNPLNTSVNYHTPRWVFDAGAQSYKSEAVPAHFVPVWDDPIFLAKHKNLLAAIAARYDGSPDIAFIDIRSYGDYGECQQRHCGGPLLSPAGFRQHIQIHLDVFRKTQLLVSYWYPANNAVYDWAITQRVGIRKDSGPATTTYCEKSLGFAPAVGEFSTGWNPAFSDELMTEWVTGGKLSYGGMGNGGSADATTMTTTRPAMIATLGNRMGYHHVLLKAVFPADLAIGNPGQLTLTWRNRGVAYMHVPCSVAAAILDAAGNVRARVWLTASQPGTWAPDTTVTENLSLSFPAGTAGTKLAVGLFSSTTLTDPDIQLGNTGKNSRGWYVLSDYPSLPNAPELQAIPGNTRTVLTWSDVAATSYTVKRALAPAGPYTVLAQGLTTLGYTDIGLTNGQTYYYVVSAFNAAGTEATSTATVSIPPGAIIKDNADTTGITLTGAWNASTNFPGYYGSNYLTANNPGAIGGKSARFTPDLPSAGTYEVYARWTADAQRATNVPIDVNSASGKTTVTVNQRLNNNTWVLLGTFVFEAGTAGNVTIRNDGTDNFVCADAIRWVAVAPAAVAAPPIPPSAILSNLSVRTTLPADQTLVVGFTVQGTKPVLLRAAGPALAALGVTGTMPDPKLVLYNGSTAEAFNDDWSGATVLNAQAALGAFPFAAGSKDAALIANATGGRTVHVSGPGAGNVLFEAYDAGADTGNRLVNLSARNVVGTGADVLIVGFTVGGSGRKTLLLRAAGPALGMLGVPGALADPKLELFDAAQRKIAENDDATPAARAVFAAVGAFAFGPDSKDSAFLATLNPGSYTLVVTGVGNTTGNALAEVYDPP